MSATADFEHAYYIGNYMSGILYGVEIVLYILTVQALRRKTPRRGDTFFILYSTVLLVLLTIDISTNAVWGEQMWITYRDQPGGVAAYLAEFTSVWYETLSSTSAVALVFMGDALLIWRLYILWGSNLLVIIIPSLVYLTAFAFAIIELVIAGEPGGNFFKGKTVTFGTVYYSLDVGLNVIITSLICGRLFAWSRRARHTLGEDSAKVYTSVASIMVESAAPYAAIGLMFLIPYARGDAIAIAFGQVWAKTTCLAPQLIVLRVCTGRAWTRDTLAHTESSLVFESRTDPTATAHSLPDRQREKSKKHAASHGGTATVDPEQHSDGEKWDGHHSSTSLSNREAV